MFPSDDDWYRRQLSTVVARRMRSAVGGGGGGSGDGGSGGGGSSGTAPDEIAGATLKYWLDADTISGVSDGGDLATWADQSGNGYDFTAGSAPSYHTGIINGKPAVWFDGTEWLSVSHGWTFPSTMIAVFAADATFNAGAVRMLISSKHNTGQTGDQLRIAADDEWETAGGTVLSTGVTVDSSWHVIGGVIGSSGRVRIDSTEVTGKTDGRNAGSPWVLGRSAVTGEFSSPPYYYKGYVAELIVYQTQLSESDLGEVFDWLAAKYGLSV